MQQIVFALALAALAALPASGQTFEDLRDLRVGATLAEMPTRGYHQFACGTNGGPPGKPLKGWGDFKECRPEASGLREVYVRFDDEMEFMSNVLDNVEGEGLALGKHSGTRVAGHPVILSVLFDDRGVLEGIRAVTDPRAGLGHRRQAFLLRIQVRNRYNPEGWECVNLPPEEGQTPVGGVFVKERCSKVYRDARRVVYTAHLFRKPGQTGADVDGTHKPGDFESLTRFEIWSLNAPVAP